MDGYSVNEAAAVLGVPEGRVWELLARGVLAGSTEVGGDMRVFLRETAVAEASKPVGSNGNGGNGGHGAGEMTPFRELLTEFRNLTERYGQALLALGEARGEVASLRGRMDLLEARIEHRPPWTEAPSTGWQTDTHTEADAPGHEPPGADADVDVDGEAGADTDAAADDLPSSESARVTPGASRAAFTSKPSRSSAKSRSREAVSGFAEALARAEDPTTAPVGSESDRLPGAQETADALAAYRRETDADHDPAPVEAESAQAPVLVPAATSIVRAGYNTATPEPDWIAEEDLLVSAGSAGSAESAPPPDDEVAVVTPPAEEASPILSVTADEWAGDEPGVVPETSVESVAVMGVAGGETIAPATIAPETIAPGSIALEIAAEPPAHDDVALLVGPSDFSEPPQVPREPAFWEPGAPSRPPFAVPHLDTWEAPGAPVRTEVRVTAPTEPLAAPTEAPVAPTPSLPPHDPRSSRTVPVMAPPDSVVLEPAPPESRPPTPPGPSAPAPGAPASIASSRRRRGPAARAIRRLRLLLD